MSKRIKPLPLKPNLTHNFITTQFINLVKPRVVFEMLAPVFSYHGFIKCGTYGTNQKSTITLNVSHCFSGNPFDTIN